MKVANARLIRGLSLAASLLDGTCRPPMLGLGLSLPGGPTQAVTQTLSSAATPIDQTIASVLDTLGVSLGNAYTWVSGVRCGHAVLVN